jgi:uncharacterized membrane protein YphA (DoxX/SURF4 family)
MRHHLTVAQPWLSTGARVFLAVVFILSGWPKLLDPDGTVRSVRAYQLVPEMFVHPFAYALPVFELALALLLLAGLGTRYTGLVTGLLMLVFIGGIASAWARGLKIECGCFGAAAEGGVEDPVPGYIKRLAEDIGFLAVAAFLVRWPRSRFALDSVLWPTPDEEPDPTQHPTSSPVDADTPTTA